ncbi:hypothetical protein [Serratia marcescens]|uniref:hypothetical protein n=2 Tax=Serratia marcescens TaxID=615 RepID=UPI0009499236|nr:hypothetical protein [Serratia marcescens]
MAELIKDRPFDLEAIPFYREMPQKPLRFDIGSTVHDFLEIDLNELDGLQPIEGRRLSKDSLVFGVNPSEDLLNSYERDNVEFQMINVIVNIYGIKEDNGVLVGKPYSISLKPMEKRGKVTTNPPSFFRHFDLEFLRQQDYFYKGFNPFTLGYEIFGNYSSLISKGPLTGHTDMLGFVINTYALANKWDFKDVLLPAMPDCSNFLREKFSKYRTRRYFKPFENVKPRKIWGCDSPIELFLLHAMDSRGLSPEIQTALFEDGSTHPSLHQMISANSKESEIRQITDADFYFPEQRLAVFCDSNAFHRGKLAGKKDARIDSELNDLNIKTIRVTGREIIDSPYACVNRIIKMLNG